MIPLVLFILSLPHADEVSGVTDLDDAVLDAREDLVPDTERWPMETDRGGLGIGSFLGIT